MGDQDHIAENLRSYVQAFSPAVRDILEHFGFHIQIEKLAKSGPLYLVTEQFANIDLHPSVVNNAQMGDVFEELIRKFAGLSKETAGEHWTPLEVIRLMVNLLFIEDDEVLTKPEVGAFHLRSRSRHRRHGLHRRGTPHQPQSQCLPRHVLRGPEPQIRLHLQVEHAHQATRHRQNNLRQHALHRRAVGENFRQHALQSTLRCGVDKIEAIIGKEYEQQSFNGRFGPGLPRVSDGSLLFLLHFNSKMRPAVDSG